MHYMTQPPQEARAPAAARNRGRLQSLAMIAVFDIGGPLALYALLRSEGLSAVTSLVLSGVFPALGVAIKFIRDRRVDAIGVLVLAGIAVGTLLGLLSGNARLVLVEGSVPTAVFGVVCLGSLWSSRPLMYRVAVEFIGADTPRGREFESLWQYQQFRRVFRVMTIVWGVAYLAEAAARVVIVELTSTGTALAISKVMPYVVAGLLVAWMIAYGNWKRRRGERAGYVPAASAQASPATQLGQTAEANAEPRTGPAGH
jgi:intracellular septation protein A